MREPDPARRRRRGGGPGAWGGAGARLPPPFIQPTVGAEGLGGQLGTGSGSAQGRVSAGLPAHQPPCPTPRSTHSWTGSFQTLKVGARPKGCLAS